MSHRRVHLYELAFGALRAIPDYLDRNRSHLRRFAGLNGSTKQSIGKVLQHWAEHAPTRVALRFEEKLWTYRELNDWANRIASSLAARGIMAGDAVAIMMENRPEVLASFLAVLKLGAIAGMVNFNQRGAVLAHSLDVIKPKAVVLSAECLEALQTTGFLPESTPTLHYFWLGGDAGIGAPRAWIDLVTDSMGRCADNPAVTEEITAEEPAYYVFTSGTTGMPKASIMSHHRWLKSSLGIGGQALRIRASDVFYCCLPLYHNNALSISLGAALSAGATLALDRKFTASGFWDRLQHYDATAFCYVGEFLRYLLNRPATDADRAHLVRLIVGNGLRPEIWECFEKRFGISRICEFYGASEGNIAFINAFSVRQTAGFSPASFAIVEFDPDAEQPIRNGNGRMLRVRRGGSGLLLSEVSKAQPFDGYTDPAASEKKLLRDVFKPGDCWFNTGDLVRDQGLRHIQFVDRVGDTFRWKGENVATGEVEGVLACNPRIEHGVVYGVTVPGCDGRAGMAAITLKQAMNFDGALLAQELAAVLPPYAVPLFVRLRRQHEATGTFKYRKVELKQEGFDPGRLDEPLFALADRARGYEPLTPQLYQRICAGAIRF